MTAITFIGATGRLGVPVVQQLVAAGHTVTCLVREPAKARRLLPPEVRLVPGDLRKPGTIAAAVEGQEVTYLNLSVDPASQPGQWQPEREGIVEVIKAARRANHRRLLYLSSLILDHHARRENPWWVFNLKQTATYIIRECGVPNTIFRPSTFMENFLPGGLYRDGGANLLLAGTSREPMHFIAAADYGRQVARAIDLDVGHEHYAVQGPQAFTADQAAAIFQANCPSAPGIKRRGLALLKLQGNFSQKINHDAHLAEALNQFPEPFGAERTWERLGRPTTTLADFARQAQ